MEDIAQGLTKDANPAHEFDLNKPADRMKIKQMLLNTHSFLI
jgi:hypothetical protein